MRREIWVQPLVHVDRQLRFPYHLAHDILNGMDDGISSQGKPWQTLSIYLCNLVGYRPTIGIYGARGAAVEDGNLFRPQIAGEGEPTSGCVVESVDISNVGRGVHKISQGRICQHFQDRTARDLGCGRIQQAVTLLLGVLSDECRSPRPLAEEATDCRQ